MQEINLLRTEITSFRGISSDSPVVLDFTQANKKGKRVTKLEGDQGTGKTSTIQALLYSLTGLSDFKEATLINKDDATIKLENEFTIDGERYRVYATKSKFELQRFVDGKNGGKWYAEDNPKTLLRQLIGVVATSPMHLQKLSGEKQIDWFRKTFSADSEKLEAKEKKLRETFKLAEEKRRDANRDYTSIKQTLSQNIYYNERQKWDSQFKDKKISKEDAEKAFNEATEKYNNYKNVEAEIPKIADNIASIDNDIRLLEERLAHLKERRTAEVEKKEKGEKWLKDNAGRLQVFESAKEAFMNVSEMLNHQKQYQMMLTTEEEMHEFETIIQRFDNQKDDLTSQLRELTKQYLPDIPELEIKIANGLTETEEGIFFQGKSLAMLSESELWGLFCLIWQQKDVQFVLIENVQDLGSHAVEILNALVGSGVKVFASQMNRKQDSMKITFTDEIK